MPNPSNSNFFNRRNSLGLVTDVAIGAFAGMQYGLFGSLFLGAAGATVIGASLPAVATACAIGGAIAIIPIILLREKLDVTTYNSNFLLKVASNTVFRTAFAFSTGLIGAAIMGLAITPVVLTAMTAALVFGVLRLIGQSLHQLGIVLAQSNEKLEDKSAAYQFA